MPKQVGCRRTAVQLGVLGLAMAALALLTLLPLFVPRRAIDALRARHATGLATQGKE